MNSVYSEEKRIVTIVLSILLRFTDSDYPFGIFRISLRLHGQVEPNGHRFHVRPNSKPRVDYYTTEEVLLQLNPTS
jgi:hypothetical protein